MTESAEAGGMDVRLAHPLTEYLLGEFGLDRDGLVNLAFFLLAHASVDRALIVKIGLDEVSKRGGADKIELDEILGIFMKASGGMFGKHLAEARGRGLLQAGTEAIASEINSARNSFLHWQPNRGDAPTYRGRSIVGDDGLFACLSDVLTVLKS